MVSTTFICFFNIFAYFVRYDPLGYVSVFAEIWMLPLFFVSLYYIIATLPGSPIKKAYEEYKMRIRKLKESYQK